VSEVSRPPRARTRWRRAAVLGLLIGTTMAIGVHLPGWWQSRSASAASVKEPSFELGVPAKELLGQQQLGKLIDVERAKAGCPALRPNSDLTLVARNRVVTLKTDSAGAVGRVDPQLRDAQSRAARMGFRGRVVENLAVGLGTADEVMAAWLNPRIDRALKARLDNCTFVSVGIGYDDRRLTNRFDAGVWVAVLGTD
jgi:uncharacterized protein YkwD